MASLVADAQARASDERPAPPRLAGWLAGALFIAGSAITAAAVLLPHATAIDTTGFWVLSGVQLVLGIVMFASGRARLGSGAAITALVVGGAILTLTFAVYLAGVRDGAALIAIFYVWPAIYAGYFFRLRETIVIIATIAASYWAASSLAGVDQTVLTMRTLIMVSAVAGTAAAAHVLRRYVDGLVLRLDRLARVDSLTGLTNRRGFDEQLAYELARCRRTDQTLSLALGDIDHFKLLNDRFGHAAGDEGLKSVSEALLLSARAIDTVARVGGEEFALLMPATGPQAASTAAVRLRSEVGQVTDPDGVPIEITFGIASTANPECQDADSLLLAADRALYVGKAERRGVVSYDRRMQRPTGPTKDASTPA